MNATIINDYEGYTYSTWVLGGLLLISEVLPLLKNNSNGMLHTLLCLVKGSKCVAAKLEEAIEVRIDLPRV